MSLSSVFIDKCYAAYTGTRLDGLLSFRHQRILYLDFFATAPWNYYGTSRQDAENRIRSRLFHH